MFDVFYLNVIKGMDTIKQYFNTLAGCLFAYERAEKNRYPRSSFKKIYFILFCIVFFGLCSPAFAMSKEEELSQKVLAIISYTKWDAHQSHIQLCVVSSTKYANAIENATLLTNPIKIIVTKPHYDVSILSSQCDVIYFGNISPAQQQNVIAARKNRVLLTISEDNPECEVGSSFCLDPESTPITFKVNLDSLTRSGIYVNPNVLLLGRKKTIQ